MSRRESGKRSACPMIWDGVSIVCMYVCIKNYVRAAAYSLDCHEGAMINCRHRTFQSLNVNRTEPVTSSCRELSVVVSSTVLGQSTRNFVVHSSWFCSNWWQGILSLLNVDGSDQWMMRQEYTATHGRATQFIFETQKDAHAVFTIRECDLVMYVQPRLCVCLSVCPVRTLTFESLDQETLF